MRISFILGAVALLGGTAFAIAQTDHSAHGDGMDHAVQEQGGSASDALLTEPGQGAFAVLSEVVRVLEADPDTD